eukprot:TRINITY_DN26383_c0_g1_i4.p1 TRINITY_DN26383_c0_g1~~TRINITY_DN26383_c0_g1_i4.p1  ORF type:complete len:211 (-),score=30.67 TRINITY_DN26383_c0_g1_i4:437-1069(-)
MVHDLSVAPMKMDYSHLDPGGRKSVPPHMPTRGTTEYRMSNVLQKAIAAASRCRSSSVQQQGDASFAPRRFGLMSNAIRSRSECSARLGGSVFSQTPSSGRSHSKPQPGPRAARPGQAEQAASRGAAAGEVEELLPSKTSAALLQDVNIRLPQAEKPRCRFVRERHLQLSVWSRELRLQLAVRSRKAEDEEDQLADDVTMSFAIDSREWP